MTDERVWVVVTSREEVLAASNSISHAIAYSLVEKGTDACDIGA